MPVWSLYAGGALLLSAVGFAGGWQVRDWKADSDELKAVEAAIQRGREQQELADYRAGRYEEDRDEARAATMRRDTEIRTIYRTNNVVVPADCTPPDDALSVLNSAIASTNAQIAGEPLPAMPTYPTDADPIY